MKILKPVLADVFRDKTTNNLVVAIMVAIGTVTYVLVVGGMVLNKLIDAGPSFWDWGLIRDYSILYVVVLLVSDLVSRLAKR